MSWKWGIEPHVRSYENEFLKMGANVLYSLTSSLNNASMVHTRKYIYKKLLQCRKEGIKIKVKGGNDINCIATLVLAWNAFSGLDHIPHPDKLIDYIMA